MPGALRRTGVVCAAGVVCAGTAVATASPAVAAYRPDFQMPFACGQRWEGSTRASHSPSPLAIDWNRDAYDSGQIVVASAPGIVTSVVDLGSRSYGLYVVVDHGGGWTSLHAHLLRSLVVAGQRVDTGQAIALVGSSGGSTGPHLHYEQRLNRADQHASFDGERFVYNSWLTSANCVDVPIVGDWNGDQRSDVGAFARRAAGLFKQRMPDGTRRDLRLGVAMDQPVVGDWDGDGQSDVGVRSPKTGTFTLTGAGSRRETFAFGDGNDVPVSGDWDADGRWDVGVWDPATGTFFLRNSNGNFSSHVLGTPSSLPLAGDWDGDGRCDVGVYDPASATFTLALPRGGVRTLVFGTATSIPVVGFWNRDAVSDLGVWDTATGTFSKRLSATRTETIRFGRVR